MGILDRSRHKRVGFVGRVAEHNALIARAFVFIRGRIHALRDMRGLFVQQVRDLYGLVVEFVLLIANVFDASAGDRVDLAHVIFEFVRIRQAHLTANNNAVCGGKGLCCNARLGFLGEESVKDGIGNAVADLVWVSFRNGLGSERVILSCHEVLH